MKNKLIEKLKDVSQEGCVSIIMNTHRTKPEYDKDPITLKNLIKVAEDRVNATLPKAQATATINNIKALAEKIDHSLNEESLVIFANDKLADYVRLPIKVTDRVVVGDTFATRPIIRALQHETTYYILVLNRSEATLMKAINNKLLEEIDSNFPQVNDKFPKDTENRWDHQFEDNLFREYFNNVDKALWLAIREDLHPVVVVAEKRTYDFFNNNHDKRYNIIMHSATTETKPTEIVKSVWKELLEQVKEQSKKSLGELERAVSEDRIINDYSQIWFTVNQGHGGKLFVKKGFIQPAIVEDMIVTPTTAADCDKKGYVDDIIDDIIELNILKGGDVVFIEGDELSKFNNFVLVRRY